MKSTVIMVCGLMIVGCTIQPSDTMKRGPPHHMDMTPEQIEEHRKCVEEIGYTLPPPENVTPPSHEERQKFYKCIIACHIQVKGVLKNNKIDPDAASTEIDRMPQAMRFDKTRIPNCSEEANKLEDKCEVSSSFHKCMMEGMEGAFPPHMRPGMPDE